MIPLLTCCRCSLVQVEAAGGAAEQSSVPLLPAAGDESLPSLRVGSEPIKLDHLGPIVINPDGTTSRIANWDQLSKQEQEVALRRIGKLLGDNGTSCLE